MSQDPSKGSPQHAWALGGGGSGITEEETQGVWESPKGQAGKEQHVQDQSDVDTRPVAPGTAAVSRLRNPER